ncbi:MAG TPA: BadF/BadG/BcrA/BcrD ATPase family protein [Anaerolineaceae bacterium]
MTQYFLGVDIGSTKTHAIIAKETGEVRGFGEAGAGNHEVVGYNGLSHALFTAMSMACDRAQIEPDQICGAGFGVAGYDWPSERESTLQAIATLGLGARVEAVNDAVLGLLAGSEEGWGVTVVSGTGCNCWGWDRSRKRIGRVTGNGISMGEYGGASELVFKAVQAIAHAWTKRGPSTSLSQAFINHIGAKDIDDFMDGLNTDRYSLEASAAPLVFQTAQEGDPIAIETIRWVGNELGELVNAVIRQLEFEPLEFDLVMVGSMFRGGPLLIDAMQQRVLAIAPGARLVYLNHPPVVGALLLGMEQCGIRPTPTIRYCLAETFIQKE